MDDGKYWVDDDGFIAHGKEDEYVTISGQIKPLFVEPITRIIESQPDLLEALKAMRNSHGMHGPCEQHSCEDCRKAYNKSMIAIAKSTN